MGLGWPCTGINAGVISSCVDERETEPKITYSQLPGVPTCEEEAALDAVYAYLLTLHDRLDHDGTTHAKGVRPAETATDEDGEAVNG